MLKTSKEMTPEQVLAYRFGYDDGARAITDIIDNTLLTAHQEYDKRSRRMTDADHVIMETVVFRILNALRKSALDTLRSGPGGA